MALDTISIRDLDVDCVIGVYPQERDRPQPLRLDVDLMVGSERAACSERLDDTLDYEFVAAQLVFLLKSCRFRLLETAAHALSRYLLTPSVPDGEGRTPERVRLRLSKLKALGGCAIPSLEIERDASWSHLVTEQRAFGTVDVIHETKEAGIYRLNVAAGREIPLHVHRIMCESEMVLGGGLLCQDKPAAVGSVRNWPLNFPHRYVNPTAVYQSILCVDRPPFLESDESPVEGLPARISVEPSWRD